MCSNPEKADGTGAGGTGTGGTGTGGAETGGNAMGGNGAGGNSVDTETGCGCRVVGSERGDSLPMTLAGFALAALAIARRRR